jgi:hypothetical protein
MKAKRSERQAGKLRGCLENAIPARQNVDMNMRNCLPGRWPICKKGFNLNFKSFSIRSINAND